MPWAFMVFMISLKRWDPNKTMNEIDFSKCLFWIQIHNLSILKRSVGNIENIAATIGTLFKIDMEDIDCPFKRNYVRIRVSVDVNRPLLRVLLSNGRVYQLFGSRIDMKD